MATATLDKIAELRLWLLRRKLPLGIIRGSIWPKQSRLRASLQACLHQFSPYCDNLVVR
jgi:hypothetical protein